VRPTGTLTVLGLFALVSSCGGASSYAGVGSLAGAAWARTLPDDMPVAGMLRVRPDERAEPALDLRFPWSNPGASLGWGAVHLWARPGVDHVAVTAIIDAPADAARWAGCDEVGVRFGRADRRLAAVHIERPLGTTEGVYEAVSVQLDILVVRKLAEAPLVSLDVCGDPLTLTDDQRSSLQRFVEWFDEIAEPHRLRDNPSFRDVGPRPDLPGEEAEEEEPLEA
jgi:hypothetical protein